MTAFQQLGNKNGVQNGLQNGVQNGVQMVCKMQKNIKSDISISKKKKGLLDVGD